MRVNYQQLLKTAISVFFILFSQISFSQEKIDFFVKEGSFSLYQIEITNSNSSDIKFLEFAVENDVKVEKLIRNLGLINFYEYLQDNQYFVPFLFKYKDNFEKIFTSKKASQHFCDKAISNIENKRKKKENIVLNDNSYVTIKSIKIKGIFIVYELNPKYFFTNTLYPPEIKDLDDKKINILLPFIIK
jgi:S-adenosylmethionine:tRNA-ribosyltransferase-isomerase (queuine synthetase)